MKTEVISYTSLRQNLSSILNKIEENKETYFITRKQHSDVVMIAREDYESMIETLHLLSNNANAIRLNEALKQEGNGEFEQVEI